MKLGLETDEKYDKTHTDTHEVAVTEMTQISIKYGPISDYTQNYKVKPYIYWSKHGGYLVVDYVVTIPPHSWYDSQFSAPNPCLGLPWSDGNSAGQNIKQLTRDIDFKANDNKKVKIIARVRNIGLKEAKNVIVRFYQGNPNNNKQIYKDISISSIPSRGDRFVTVPEWAPPKLSEDEYVKVYCIINPNNTLNGATDQGDDTSGRIAFNIYPLSYFR